MTVVEDALEFCNSWPESKRWLASYGTKASKERVSEGMQLFCKETGLTPPELLDMREKMPYPPIIK